MERGIILLLASLAMCSAGEIFSYDGSYGPAPDGWAADFPLCGGDMQSPIDLVNIEGDPDLEDFIFVNFDQVTTPGDWTLENNGHSAETHLQTGLYFTSGGGLDTIYEAEQFHFHWGNSSDRGSEHRVEGKVFPMEMHIVHFDKKYPDMVTAEFANGAMVLSFFFEISESDNAAFAPLIESIQMSNVVNMVEGVSVTPFALTDLLPSDLSDYYRYTGSLTTPTCNQVTIWSLFKETIPISETQMEAFRSLITHGDNPLVDNFRPLQPLAGRKITRSFDLDSEPECSGGESMTKDIATHVQRVLLTMFVTVGLNSITHFY